MDGREDRLTDATRKGVRVLRVLHQLVSRRLAGAVLLALLVALPASVSQAASLRDVRVGVHPGFTRIVFDLDGPATYGSERQVLPDGRIFVDLVFAAESRPRVVSVGNPRIGSIRVTPKPGAAVVRIELLKPELQLHELRLQDPYRVVVDVVEAGRALPAWARPDPGEVLAEVRTPDAPPPTPPVSAPGPAAGETAAGDPGVPEPASPDAPAEAAAPSEPPPAQPPTEPSAEPSSSPAQAPDPTQTSHSASDPPATASSPAEPADPAPTSPPSAEPADPAPTSPPSAELADPAPAASSPAESSGPAPESATHEFTGDTWPAPSASLEADDPVESGETLETLAAEPDPIPGDAPAEVATSEEAAPPVAGGESAPAGSALEDSPTMVLVGLALLALIALAGSLFLRRQARREKPAPTTLLLPSERVSEEAAVAAVLREEPPELGSDAEPPEPGGPDPETEIEIEADTQVVPEPGPTTVEESPMSWNQAQAESGDVGSLIESLAERVQQLETRLSDAEARVGDLRDERDRLRQQLGAHTEELRVQRAAIARTQRVVRRLIRPRSAPATGAPGPVRPS